MTMPSLFHLFSVFGRIGLWSFGGPAAQIALMHRELVDRRDWLSEDQFLRALSFCMLLPGPEAMQLATYAGWRLRGTVGGLIAGLLFVLPGAVVIAVLAYLYGRFGALDISHAVMLGVKACVLVIIAMALVALVRKTLKQREEWVIAFASFVALFALALPFPILILATGIWGAVRARPGAARTALPSLPAFPTKMVAIWGTLWLSPLLVLWLMGQTLLFQIGAFFAKLAVVTFGGAYAVLAYMAQSVVQTHQWLDPLQMADALGLAETTPGPLILVTQFVGQLTGQIAHGPLFGLYAGGLTLWMTFVPCFLWIFAGAPYIDALLARPRVHAALQSVKAAVVGVILNLSLWFAIHVGFAQTNAFAMGPINMDVPVLTSLNLALVPLVALSAILLGPLRQQVPVALCACALAAVLLWRGLGQF